MTHDHWLTAAIADTAVAAEILVKFRLATSPLPSKRRRPAPPQSWTVHQRRSRTQPVLPGSNKSEPPTASPSTPLSWSGATSVSAPIADDISRSKVRRPQETTITRPRKKKTLAALKKEEVVLMEEQILLKRKLAALQANREKQIKENASLWKIKLDLQGERSKAIRNNHFEVVEERNDRIVLPDLNVPFGEDVIMGY